MTARDSLLLYENPADLLDARHRTDKYGTKASAKQTAQQCLCVGFAFKKTADIMLFLHLLQTTRSPQPLLSFQTLLKVLMPPPKRSLQITLGIRHSRLQASHRTSPRSPGSIEDPNGRLQHGSRPASLVRCLSLFSLPDIL